MANKVSKIEALGLAEDVQALLKEGVMSAAEIYRRIVQDNPDLDISYDTIRRYVAEIKDTIGTDAWRSIRAHVDKVVKDDLSALETMERLCLEWSMEGAKDQAERVADAVDTLAGELEEWQAELQRENWAAKKIVKRLITRALNLLAIDDRRQEARLRAMKQATDIISLKLRNAGLLDDDTKGRIVFVKAGETDADEPDKDGYKPFEVIRNG